MNIPDEVLFAITYGFGRIIENAFGIALGILVAWKFIDLDDKKK